MGIRKPDVSGFQMVESRSDLKCSGFRMVLDKMAAKMSGFQMPLNYKNVRFSNVSGFQTVGFRIPTVHISS